MIQARVRESLLLLLLFVVREGQVSNSIKL